MLSVRQKLDALFGNCLLQRLVFVNSLLQRLDTIVSVRTLFVLVVVNSLLVCYYRLCLGGTKIRKEVQFYLVKRKVEDV